MDNTLALVTVPAKTKKNARRVADPKRKPKKNEAGAHDRIHHMSPHFSSLIPTLTHQGRAFPYTGVVRLDVTQGVLDTVLITATNTGTSGTVFTIGVANGAGAPVFTVLTIPQLALPDNGGGPTSGRAMKSSLGLVCTTPLLSRGGRVTTLNGQSRLRIAAQPSLMSAATFADVTTTIKGMPQSQPYDNTHFGDQREMSGCVVDAVTYEDFEEFVGTESLDEFWEHIAAWPGSTRRDRPMNTCWIVLSPPAFQQTYTVSMKASFYTRWGLHTVAGQSQFDVPTAPPSVLNRIQTFATTMADTVHTLAEIGATTAQYVSPFMAAAEYAAPRLALGM